MKYGDRSTEHSLWRLYKNAGTLLAGTGIPMLLNALSGKGLRLPRSRFLKSLLFQSINEAAVTKNTKWQQSLGLTELNSKLFTSTLVNNC